MGMGRVGKERKGRRRKGGEEPADQ